MRPLIVSLVALAACNPTNTDDGDGTPRCGSTAPVLGEIVVSDVGTVTIRGEERRAIQIASAVTDDDGDLYRYSAFVWYDTLVDGQLPANARVTVNVDVADPNEGGDTAEDGACRFRRVNAGAVIPIGDNGVPPGEQVEFGLVVADASGNRSNGGTPTIVVADVPDL